MDAKLDVASLLKQTCKGRLKYDKHWYKTGKIEDIMLEFSSPRAIRIYTPSAATCKRTSFITDDSQDQSSLDDTDRTSDSVNADTTKEHTSFIVIDEVHDKSSSSVIDGESVNDNSSSTNNESSHQDKPVEDKLDEDFVISSDVLRSEKAMADYERERDNIVRSLLEERSRLFKENSERLAAEAQNKVYQVYTKIENDALHFLHRAEAQDKQRLDEIHEKQRKLREHHKRHAQMLDAKWRRAEEQRKQIEEEEEQIRKEELKDFQSRLARVYQDIKEKTNSAQAVISGCKYKSLLGDEATKYLDNAKKISLKAEAELKQVLIGQKVSKVAERTLQDLLVVAANVEDYAKTIIESVTKKGEEAERQEAAAAAAAASASVAAPQTTSKQDTTSSTTATKTSDSKISSRLLTGSNGVSYVTAEGFTLYKRLQETLEEQEKLASPITNDPQLKKYKMELQKAVNTPVNAISTVSGAHLRDKLTRLCSLLAGQSVEVGGKRVSVTQHPAAIPFCKNLLAKKIVSQGVEQVSSNHQSSFAIALVAVGVWCEFPDVGDLILAHFYKQCPYLVPYYKQISQNPQEEEQYYKQDKFLKSMTGMMRLYAAVMVATPARGAQHPHPHSIQHAWVWLTSIMNLDPRPAITATMVYDLLQVTGHSLWKTYGKQFLKLLQVFCTDYVSKIKQTSESGGGPVVRLENYLQQCISSGRIAPPEGLLPPNFWYT